MVFASIILLLSASPSFWGSKHSWGSLVSTKSSHTEILQPRCAALVSQDLGTWALGLDFPLLCSPLCWNCFPRSSASVRTKRSLGRRKKSLKPCKGKKQCMVCLPQSFVNAIRFICLEYSASPISVVLRFCSNKYVCKALCIRQGNCLEEELVLDQYSCVAAGANKKCGLCWAALFWEIRQALPHNAAPQTTSVMLRKWHRSFYGREVSRIFPVALKILRVIGPLMSSCYVSCSCEKLASLRLSCLGAVYLKFFLVVALYILETKLMPLNGILTLSLAKEKAKQWETGRLNKKDL